MILADYGADVVKVEKPGQGDDTRTWGPPYVEDQSAYFLSINRNKQSIAVDMSRPEGQTIIRQVGSIVENECRQEKNLLLTRLLVGQ